MSGPIDTLSVDDRRRLAGALRLVALVEASWPSSRFEDQHRKRYAEDIAHLDQEEARAAVETLKRSGREFAPTAGEIAREVARLQLDAPDWSIVKRQLIQRHAAIVADEDPVADWECPTGRCDGSGFVDVSTPALPNTVTDCSCRPERLAAARRANPLHPLVREWVNGRYVTWTELADVATGDGRDARALEAQMRSKWDAYAARAIDSRVLAAVQGPGTLTRLDAARAEDTPRRDPDDLAKPDYLAALPPAS